MQSQFENVFQCEKSIEYEYIKTLRESCDMEYFKSELLVMPTGICAAKERNVELPRIVLTKKAMFPQVLSKPDWIPFEIIEDEKKMRILRLPIKKQWFDMIRSGEKPEEYREIKLFYLPRFIHCKHIKNNARRKEMCWSLNNLISIEQREYINDSLKWRKYDCIEYINGYQPNSPSIKVAIENFSINTGKPEWGAEPDKLYFVIKLGKKIEE